MSKWRVVIDDTGGPYTGWPSIVDDEADCCILYDRAWFDDYRPAGVTMTQAIRICQHMVMIHNSGQVYGK